MRQMHSVSSVTGASTDKKFKSFQNLFCILLNNIYVCGLSSMNLKPHLVSEVRKVQWQNGGQGPITLGVMSLDWSGWVRQMYRVSSITGASTDIGLQLGKTCCPFSW